ncbi:MAG: hypothetical protein JJE52_16915 [Acidimicrobiia bacterium]|nr:hypothetical protein [Acidimicrobiia bacterium]
MLGDATLTVRPWVDPIIDELGHDLRSHYVERFWLGILGPSTTLLLRRIATGFDISPDGFTLQLADTARSLGLGDRAGRHSPFLRALDRCCQFGMARRHLDQFDVRRRLPPLTRLHLARLPDSLQAEHQQWAEAAHSTPTPQEVLRRARRLALGLFELGEDIETVEGQLHQWRFHPAMAHDAVRWALERHQPAVEVAPGRPDRDAA